MNEYGELQQAITAIKEALAQPAPYMAVSNDRMTIDPFTGNVSIGTPQRTWVELTEEDIVLIVAECAASHQHTDIHFARAIEARLKEKNT